MTDNDLSQLRQTIDTLDREILNHLNQRAQVALKIAEVKKAKGLPILDSNREQGLLSAICAANPGPLSDAALKRIFREVIGACRSIQNSTRVSFLGPEATFSHAAALEHFGLHSTFMPRGSIGDVFREVEFGQADYGVVPAENSTQGSVGVTMDEWMASNLKIIGETLFPVSLVLLSREADLSRIDKVLSHVQPLNQARSWLARNLPRAEVVEAASTAAAAQKAAAATHTAAVGAEMLADRYGLNVLAHNIQDHPLNLTRFFILGRHDCPPTGRDKTSILFFTAHRPGSLHSALAPLADAGVNMTRLESRPSQRRPWDYAFFVDFEGHQSDDKVQAALSRLREEVESLKILGSYPAATPLDQNLSLDEIMLKNPKPALAKLAG